MKHCFLPFSYDPKLSIYLLNDKSFSNKILQNSIQLKVSTIQNEQQPQKKNVPIKKFIYPEEMLYIVMVADLDTKNSKNITKEQFQNQRRQFIHEIYSNLSEQGYDKFQFLHFFVQMRKKSKLIKRWAKRDLYPLIPIFKVYSNVQCFKKDEQGELVLLCQSSQKVKEIILIKKKLQILQPLQICILQNLSSITVEQRSFLSQRQIQPK